MNNNNYKWETVGNAKFYTDGTTCTDIEVMDNAKTVSFIYPKFKIDRETCQKVFSSVENLIIERNVLSIIIPNKMFPNVKKVESESSNFIDGKYLIERTGMRLRNAFGQNENAVIDFTQFNRIENYAFEGCKAKNAVGLTKTRFLNVHGDAAFDGSGFLDQPFIGGIKCLGPFIIDIDETVNEIVLPEKIRYCVPKRPLKCIRVSDIDTLSKIRKLAFYGCAELKEIDFGHGITRIGENGNQSMFSGCAFKKITFPPQIKEIGMRAFSLCYELEEVIFNEGLEVIQKEAFQNCPNLLEINLPASIKKVGTNAFVYNGSYSHIPDMNINITTIPENLGLAITHPGNTYGVRCVNVHIDNRNGIFDFVLPCSVSVIVGARTNIIINQMADCKYAKKLSGLRYLETAYMNASNSMYKYAVAYKTYKKAKNKCAKEFLLDNQKHVAKAIILEMEEKDFADFVKFDFINLKYDEDIVKCLEERNWTAALAYMLEEGKGRPEDALVI